MDKQSSAIDGHSACTSWWSFLEEARLFSLQSCPGHKRKNGFRWHRYIYQFQALSLITEPQEFWTAHPKESIWFQNRRFSKQFTEFSVCRRKTKRKEKRKKSYAGVITPQAWIKETEALLSDSEVLTLPGGFERATPESLAWPRAARLSGQLPPTINTCWKTYAPSSATMQPRPPWISKFYRILVKWDGYKEEHNTWEPKWNLQLLGCDDLVREYKTTRDLPEKPWSELV